MPTITGFQQNNTFNECTYVLVPFARYNIGEVILIYLFAWKHYIRSYVIEATDGALRVYTK